MAQLTLKELAQRIEDLAADIHIEDIQLRLDVLEEAQVWDSSQAALDSDTTDAIPPWGIEVVEALVEALKGVRLQGAQTFALALEAKYFPLEEVVEEEVVA